MFLFMSSSNIQAYTKNTLSKALFWLKTQPKDWANHINADTAVRLYLNSQNQEKEKNKSYRFQKELQKFCHQSPDAPVEQAPLKNSPEKQDTRPQEDLALPLSPPAKNPEDSPKEFDLALLDLNSQDLILKTKESLNLSHSEEALRTLLQLGYKSLKSLLKS
ncbi:MAG: hypothetical protein ACR2M7_03225 [Bdellovibrionales bacterium]